jgi:hypothetical protein
MKTKHTILGCLILLMFSCYKDNSSGLLKKSSQLIIKNIEAEYNLVVGEKDHLKLKINPNISFKDKYKKFKDSEFKYYWTYYGERMNKSEADTIGKEKQLDYKASDLKSGNFKLVFIIKNIKTGISVFKETKLSVETIKLRGWYILKDQNGYTDLDLYTNGKSLISDIIRKSGETPLKGNAVRIGFTAHYAYLDMNESEINKREKIRIRCLIPMSTNDVAVLQIEDTKKLANHKDLFYLAPEVIKPAFWISKHRNISYANDGKLYRMTSDSPFSRVGFAITNAEGSDYFLSKYFIQPQGTVPLTVFDTIQSSFYFFDSDYNKNELVSCNKSKYPTKKLNSYLLYMSYQTKKIPNSDFPPYFRGEVGTGIALLKKKDSGGLLSLAYLNFFAGMWYWYADPSAAPPFIYKQETLSTGLDLAKADLYAINRTKDFLYYTKDNKISYYDMQNKTETLIHSLDAGEKITYIHHSLYKEKDTHAYDFDYLVVASHSNGNYKVYLFEILSNGKLKDNPIIIEGKGKVAHVLYVSPQVDEYRMDDYVNYNY